MQVGDLALLADALRQRLSRADAGTGSPIDMASCLHDLDRLIALLRQQADRSQRTIAELRSTLAVVSAGERRARRRALCDPLTRLPNRDVFFAKLAEALASDAPRQIAVFYLDVDHFKAINDRHGHHTGDAVLRIVAARLTAALRADDLVCRMGGDEFACLLLGAPDDALLSHVAEKLLDAVAAPLCIGSLRLTVRPSIGIASWPEGGGTVSALVANADAAMYHAKQRCYGYAFVEQSSQRIFPRTTLRRQASSLTQGSLPAASAVASAQLDTGPKLVLSPMPLAKVTA